MQMKRLKKISQILFYLGFAVSLAVGGYTFYLQRITPPGLCPLNPARPYMGVGIALLVSSLLIDAYIYIAQKRGGGVG
jgi:hypothetical protein